MLHLEDSPRDAELTLQKLTAGGLPCEIVRVDSQQEFEAALAREVFDVILCDHNLPNYDGRLAIKLACERLPLVPVISLSGTAGEEEAVETLKLGATDYVLKHRLDRLVPAVKRALQQAEERRARLRAEAASHESEEQFRAMFEVAAIGMAQADPHTGQFLRVNQKLCAITGYSAAELLQMRVSELTHPDDRQRDHEKFQAVVRGEASDYRIEKRYVRKDGTLAWVNVNMTVLRDAAGQPTRTMAAIENITERRQSEQRVRELNQVLRATGAVNALMVRERDPQRLLAEAGQILVQTRGYRFAWIGRVEAGSKRVVEQARAGKDTGYFDTLTITWDDTPTGRGPIGTAIRTGQLVACQDIAADPRMAPYREDAKARGIASMAAMPMIYGSQVLGAVAVYSERAGAFDAEELSLLNELAGDLGFALQSIEHEQQRKQLESQLHQAQKMEAVGQLAGGVAHDFNNMLAIIRGNAELLLMNEEQLTADTRDGLTQVVNAAERAANLTRQLLAFSRRQVLQTQPLVLNEVVASLTRMLRRVIGENIDLQCDYAAPLPHVQADPGMMEQVILNLVVNARDAMPQGGQVRVTTERVSFAPADAQANPEVSAGAFVCLRVSDTGTGIAPEVLPRIFEPFFTTKELGRGTGLGLATVYGIIKQHRGWIEVASQVGQGTTFKVFLPAIPAPAGAVAAAPEAGADIRGGNEMLLLVEDDPAVRLTTRRVLESKGYRIQEATNAREALELWSSQAGEIALLITDIIMPEQTTGRDLAEQLWSLRPDLKVIFISGYSVEVLGKDTDYLQRTNCRFLQKPCSTRNLLDTVRRCLDGKG